jgi:hypothetical protein
MIQPAVLQNLDGIIERATSRGYAGSLDVSKVNTVLRDGEGHHRPSRKSWVIGIIAVLVGFGIFWFVWYIYIYIIANILLVYGNVSYS